MSDSSEEPEGTIEPRHYEAPEHPIRDAFLYTTDVPPVWYHVSRSAMRTASDCFDSMFAAHDYSEKPEIPLGASAAVADLLLPYAARDQPAPVERRGFLARRNALRGDPRTGTHFSNVEVSVICDAWHHAGVLGMATARTATLAMVTKLAEWRSLTESDAFMIALWAMQRDQIYVFDSVWLRATPEDLLDAPLKCFRAVSGDAQKEDLLKVLYEKQRANELKAQRDALYDKDCTLDVELAKQSKKHEQQIKDLTICPVHDKRLTLCDAHLTYYKDSRKRLRKVTFARGCSPPPRAERQPTAQVEMYGAAVSSEESSEDE